MLIRTIFRIGQSLLAQASPYLSVCISWRNILGNRMGQGNKANKQAKIPPPYFWCKNPVLAKKQQQQKAFWRNSTKRHDWFETEPGVWELAAYPGNVVGDASTVWGLQTSVSLGDSVLSGMTWPKVFLSNLSLWYLMRLVVQRVF